MNAAVEHARTARSADGTAIGYRSVGLGEPVVVVGGVLRSARDYMPLATELARHFEVHVIDRRGRGASGPIGRDYSMDRECEDLDAVLGATGARRIFGHSYGGLVALEYARRNAALAQLALYEPGVSVGGSIALSWLPAYARRLEGGDARGAFAEMVRGSGHAPALLSKLPVPLLKPILRGAVRGEQWQRMEPLLAANLVEHEEIRRLEDTLRRYERVAVEALLLGGTKSPTSVRASLDALAATMPNARRHLIEGLAHTAPEETAPAAVAEVVAPFFGGVPSARPS